MTLFQQANEVHKGFIEKGFAPPPKTTKTNTAFAVALVGVTLVTAALVMGALVKASDYVAGQ